VSHLLALLTTFDSYENGPFPAFSDFPASGNVSGPVGGADRKVADCDKSD